MTRRVVIEVCVDRVDDALAALAAGADRVEFCRDLHADGLTPDFRVVPRLLRQAHGKVWIMIRDRPGPFTARGPVLDAMLKHVRLARAHRAAGVVFGILLPDHSIDSNACAALLRAAGDLPAVFHRAFDLCPDPLHALDALIALGFRRVLTSGGPSLADPAAPRRLAALVRHAAGRIEIMAGGGLRPANVRHVLASGCDALHASCRDRSGRFSQAELRGLRDAVDS